MTKTVARRAARLLTAEPQIYVGDVDAACRFYTTKLGFAVAFRYGDPAFYAQVVRDGAHLNLRGVPVPVIDPALRARDDLLSATITLDDAGTLYREYQSAEVPFHQALRTEPWGAETFIVRDPDGNLILFAGSAAA